MAGSMFSRVIFPTLVKVYTSELSRISSELAASLLEFFMRSYSSADATPASGIIEGLVCSDSGTGLVVAVSAGLGFRYDSTGVDLTAYDDHPYRLISLRTATTVTLDAADPANDRIDIVCVTDGEADARNTSVQIWSSILRHFGAANRYLETRNSPSVVRVTGTPAVVPAAPATPAGYLKLYEVTVPAAAVDLSGATFTDSRTRIGGPGYNWANCVREAGDTMTGELNFADTVTNAIAILRSGVTPIGAIRWGAAKTAGLFFVGANPIIPRYEFRAQGGSTAGSHLEAGKVYARDDEVHFSEYGAAAGSIYKLGHDATKTYSLKAQDVEAGTELATGHFKVTDENPAPAAAVADDVLSLWKCGIPFAMAIIDAAVAPAVTYRHNVSAVARIGAGIYDVTLAISAASTAEICPFATALQSTDTNIVVTRTAVNTLRVYVTDSAGVGQDWDFSLVVYILPSHP